MRIIVSGSREWTDRLAIYRVLNEVCNEFGLNYPPDEYGNTMPDPSKVTIVHGGCPTGADQIADDWCISNDFLAEVHPADWKKYGKAAGPIRNEEMVALGADLVTAFPKGKSSGTRNCITLASEAGIPVRVLEGYDIKGDNHGDEDYDKL